MDRPAPGGCLPWDRLRRRGRLGLGCLAGAMVLAVSGHASAYCRTNTCEQDKDNPNCGPDATGCLAGGEALYWDRGCFSFSVHAAGSPLRHISYEQAAETIGAAMAVWSNAQCDGGKLGIDSVPFPAVVCDQAEYNTDGPNANLWVFRDEEWPYADDGRTLALTLVTFNVKTGEIYDADVEVNSHAAMLSHEGGASLAEIATHEAGHIYGLAHSSDPHAIMYPNYSALAGISAELTDDDRAGVCSIYPPSSASKSCDPTPRHGFSAECGGAVSSGCAMTPLARRQSSSWAAWSAAGLLLLLGRRSHG
jgi:hypothetical protein